MPSNRYRKGRTIIRRKIPCLALVPVLAALAVPVACAHAQEVEFEHIADDVDALRIGAPRVGGPKGDTPQKRPDLLMIPLPVSGPATGAGVVLAGVVFYNPNNAPEPWITGVGLIKTSKGANGIGGLHSMSLDDDRIRLKLLAGYIDTRVKFFGIGAGAGDRNIHVPLRQSDVVLKTEAQVRIVPRVYMGLRYSYRSVDARLASLTRQFTISPPPATQRESMVSSLAPTLVYDRRDNSLNPQRGEYASYSLNFATKALGSDFAYRKLQLGANLYRPLFPRTTLALRGGLCAASANAPYYDLCKFGASGDLRGYLADRYRDGATWALQGELRQHLFGRFGATAFAGVGGIAPSVGDFGSSRILPAAGLGLRYAASRSNPVNFRLDVAVGRDSSAAYLSLGEAF